MFVKSSKFCTSIALPYYPQCNGAGGKKLMGSLQGSLERWWSVNQSIGIGFWMELYGLTATTYKQATQFTPFHLVYGQEALQPIELDIPTIEAMRNEGKSEEEILANHLLKWVELDGKRNLAIECYQRQAIKQKKLFDTKLKDKGITEGSLVLRYNNKLDNRFDVKFISRWEGPFVVLQCFIFRILTN